MGRGKTGFDGVFGKRRGVAGDAVEPEVAEADLSEARSLTDQLIERAKAKREEQRSRAPTDKDLFSEVLGDKRGTDRPETVTEEMASIQLATKKLSHSGDYGHLYWHPERGHVFWTAADSDGPDMGVSAPWDIEEAFAAVDCVNMVSVEAEAMPTENAESLDYGEEEADGWHPVHNDAEEGGDPDLPDEEIAVFVKEAEERRVRWLAGLGGSRIGDTWVRPGHEAECQAWKDASGF